MNWNETNTLEAFNLTPGHIHFFYTHIDQARDPVLAQALKKTLNNEEKERINRFVFEKDRHTRLVARTLLRRGLSRCTGMAPEFFHFTENRYGKPELAPDTIDLPICFNISHSRKMVVCAFTLNHAIGADIEDTTRSIELSIADRFFTKQEADLISRTDESVRKETFFRFWTLKEAYIKARGKGLSIGLDRFGFIMDQPEIQVVFHEDYPDHPDFWQFFQFSPLPGYTAAIAVNKQPHETVTLSVHQWIPSLKSV